MKPFTRRLLPSILLLTLISTSPGEGRAVELVDLRDLRVALKTKLTKAGKIEGALAVKAELDKQPAANASSGNQLIGRWVYGSSQGEHTRVFTADTVTLSRGKKKVWTMKYRLITPTFAVIDDGQMNHELKEDGKLHIQGKYTAKRS